MSTVKDLHHRAMEIADLAFERERVGEKEAARESFADAAILESQAADLADRPDAEPTRSILFRSAATLAFHAGQTALAERLIHRALSGSPPPVITEELRSLYERVTFHRHLEVRGVELFEDEFQMTLVGSSIGPGFAPSGEFLPRVDAAQKLVCRTAERWMGLPYRAKGPVPKDVKNEVYFYLSTPRSASFAVSFRVGGRQQKLSGMSLGGDVVNEIIDCLGYFAGGEEVALRARISEKAYYANFLSLAKLIAPDGKDIEAVGFTAVRSGRSRSVTLTAVPAKLYAVPTPADKMSGAEASDEGEPVTVEGTLKYADERLKGSEDMIGLRDVNGLDHMIVVQPGMIDDIVTHLWDKVVQVPCIRRRNKLVMTDTPSTVRE